MKLRPYTPEDLPRVLALFRNTVHTVCAKDYTPEQLEAWAPETLDETRWQETLCAHYSLIAEENGQLMGFADLEEPDYFDRLYVAAHCQRQGIGAQLAEAMETRARELGTCVLKVHASKTARPFFESRGYRVVLEQTVERHGVTLTNFAMEKSL